MTIQLSSDDLRKISRFVNEHIGLSYASDRMSDLSRGFISACRDLGGEKHESCLKMLEDSAFSSKLEELLIKKLTIGETYFFRDRNLFAQLRDQLLPDLIRTRRRERKYLRIWCAACSSGEEPYSIAMLLRYLIPDLADWEISILATDIHPDSLHTAEQGIYSRWSFREKAPVPSDLYISSTPDGRFQVSPEIRRMVRFSRLNLITDHYPSVLTGTTTMDLIICRNVLMYFSLDMASSVVDRMRSALTEKGWFVVSPQEISYVQQRGFVQVKRSSVFLFQKGHADDEKTSNINSFADCSQEPVGLYEDISQGMKDNEPVLSGSVFPSHNLEAHLIAIPDSGKVLSVHDPLNTLVPTPISEPLLSGSHDISHNPGLLIQAGLLSDAEYQLLQTRKTDEKTLVEMVILARAYADQGKIEHALGWCDRILAMEPLSSGAYHLRAVIQQDQGDILSAVQSLRQALYADPDYVPAHLMLGMIMGSQGRQVDARRHYQVVLQILSAMADDAPVEETDGMPVARIREMVTTLLDGVQVS